jgi:hypothetical protein
MKLLIAVVEIEGTAGLIVLAVFVIVLGLVAFLAWMILRNVTGRHHLSSESGRPSQWH